MKRIMMRKVQIDVNHEGEYVDGIDYGSCMLVQMGSITMVCIGINHDSKGID